MNEGFLQATIIWTCPQCAYRQEEQIILQPHELAQRMTDGLDWNLICVNCGHSGVVHIKVVPLDALKTMLDPQQIRHSVLVEQKTANRLARWQRAARYPSEN